MSKMIFAIVVGLVCIGCSDGPDLVEPTLETTPWLFPEPNIEQLSSEDFQARAVAAKSLGRMGAKAEEAIPHLEKLIEEDENPKVREVAKTALDQIRAAVGN